MGTRLAAFVGQRARSCCRPVGLDRLPLHAGGAEAGGREVLQAAVKLRLRVAAGCVGSALAASLDCGEISIQPAQHATRRRRSAGDDDAAGGARSHRRESFGQALASRRQAAIHGGALGGQKAGSAKRPARCTKRRSAGPREAACASRRITSDASKRAELPPRRSVRESRS